MASTRQRCKLPVDGKERPHRSLLLDRPTRMVTAVFGAAAHYISRADARVTRTPWLAEFFLLGECLFGYSLAGMVSVPVALTARLRILNTLRGSRSRVSCFYSQSCGRECGRFGGAVVVTDAARGAGVTTSFDDARSRPIPARCRK